MSKINSPWRLDKNEIPLRIVDAEDFIVCSMYPSGLADATLIAAAPDLLDILTRCADYLDCIPESAAGGDDDAVILARSARAAIAKAEGK